MENKIQSKPRVLKLVIVLSMFIIGILFLLFLSLVWRNEDLLVNNDVGEDINSGLLWQSYTYDESYILPGFSISYPAWEEKFNEASGSWDIELKNGDSEISIDLSAQGALNFEQSLSDWVTNWGSYNIEYTYTQIENGTLQGDRNYVIYNVNQSEKNPYLIAIVDVAKMYEGRGHLAIKSEQEGDLDYLREILATIQTVD